MADTVSTQPDGVVLGSANAEARLSVAGFGGVAFQVQGTFSGTITFEASVQGQDFTAFRVVPANSSTPTSTTTTTGLWSGSCVGYLVVRARMSSYASGAATVLIRADVASPGGGGGGGGAGSDVNLIEVGGQSIALGQAAMAASMPVVVASDQSAIDVNVVSGGGGSSPFGDPMPASGVPIGFEDASGDLAPVVLEADGSLPVTVVSGGGSNASVSATGSAVPADATFIGVDDGSGDLSGLAATTFDFDTGGGTVPQSAFGIALPGAGGPVAGGTATNPLRVDPTGSTTQPVSGSVTANAGTNLNTSALALEATLSSLNGKVTAVNTGAVTISAALPAGTNNIGDVDVASIVFNKKILWDGAPASQGTVLTTELNALGDGAFSAVGTAYDNTSNGFQFGCLEVNLASLNPTAGAYVQLFLVQSLDGTNYEDPPSSTNPGIQMAVCLPLNVTTGSATKRIASPWFRLPAGKMKFVLYNDCNVSLGATGNTVTLYAANDEIQ